MYDCQPAAYDELVAPPEKTSPSRRRAPRGQGERLRERLLDSATELIHEKGDAGALSIRQVTRHAGVSPMALYLHFSSLDDLVEAVIDHGFMRFRAALHAAAAGAAPEGTRARMRALGLAYLRFAREEPALYSVIFGPHHPHADEATGEVEESGVGMAAFGDLVEAIAACQQAGEARQGDPHALAIGVWSTLHGFATLRHAHAHPDLAWPDDEAFCEAVYSAWLG